MDVKKNLLDVLNATIGTFKFVEDEINKKKEEIKENFEKLSHKGSEDNSEVSEKSRQLIEKFVDDTQGVIDGLEKVSNDFKEKVAEVVDKLPINLKKQQQNMQEAPDEDIKESSETTSLNEN